MDRKLRINIGVLYAFSFFWMSLVILPVIVPFFESKGLTLAQVFYLQAIFASFVVLFEVPSGYFADMIGRKNVLVAGSLFHGLGFTWLCFADDFAGLVLFEMTVAVGISLMSGADLSLLYDSQDALGQTATERGRGIANMRFAKSSAEGASALLSTFLIAVSLDATVIANAMVAWVPLVLSLFLTEAPFVRMEKGQHLGNLKTIVSHLFLEDRLLRLICLAITMFGLMTFYVVWMFQPYWKDQGVPLTAFGILWAAQCFVLAFATRLCIPMENRFGPKAVLIVMALLPILGYFGMALTGGLVGILAGFAFFLSRGLNNVILTDALNRRVPASFRSTANSMTSFMFRGVYIVTGPAIGFLIGEAGMEVKLFVLVVLAPGLFV
ncbi:MAG: MFS transporter, partial [Pseudomonadales bacterium]|nr:MFS transporter [Pseudomonadales bacterium]